MFGCCKAHLSQAVVLRLRQQAVGFHPRQPLRLAQPSAVGLGLMVVDDRGQEGRQLDGLEDEPQPVLVQACAL